MWLQNSTNNSAHFCRIAMPVIDKIIHFAKPLSVYEKIMANLIMFSSTNKICSACILFSNPIHRISPLNESRNCKCVSAQIYKQGISLNPHTQDWINDIMTDHNALHQIFYHLFSGLYQAESVQAGEQMIEGSIQLN